ncbi:ABC transporter substrate-binding protein [Paenimyroides tangerinum]|uniref:ABC transporter substrate-binding protein n=1 Tax=Paenimyroides tangerinum TaxID=2488728 RepID=A0A3P3W7N0_9FLAO|nr:two-component regulator propeller domain-containing protein [Paenimyroides tangerinum]RRJ90347.1 ABC transporter substrate-binding protein [Paenimyroides tangerinum]
MKFLYNILFLFLSVSAFAQNQIWKGYFSYNEVRAIAYSSSKTYFATDNAVFAWSDADETSEIYNSINGFKAFDISAIAHSSNFNKIIIGNTNGQIAIIDEVSGNVILLNDIVNKNSIPDNIKKINDIYVDENLAYVSTDYGISVIRLNDNNFGDSYYIGNSGEYTKVLQTTVVGGYIFSITEDYGLKRISISNQNKIDYAQWQIYDASKWLSIANLDGSLVGVKEDLTLNRFENDLPIAVGTVYGGFYKITAFNKELTVVTHESVRLYNQNLSFQFEYLFNDNTGRFNCALVKNGTFFLGTKQDGAMIIDRSTNSERNISPTGPYSNRTYKLFFDNNDFYVVFGGMTVDYGPVYTTFGISKYNTQSGWNYLKPANLHNVRATNNISINPRKKGHMFLSSFLEGMVDITLDSENFSQSTSELYDYTNSPLSFVVDGSVNTTRVSGPTFDRNGTGWVSNSWSNAPLKSFDLEGNWRSYSFSQFFSTTGNNLQDKEKFGVPLIDKNNTKWLATNNNGIFAFNETRNNKSLQLTLGTGNLPSAQVNSIAIDNNNQLWIGTLDGLRVLSSVDQFINSNVLRSNSIIILQDGVAEELFYKQQILRITVDGANNKWVSVSGGGVFLVSPNGQETIYQFNMQNSPLPSNDVIDISINGKTGEVFFLTSKGIVSFLNFATDSSEKLDNVKVFPNPVRPDFTGEVKIAGLVDESNVKITDVAGNLVFEKKSEGGTVLWNTHNFSGNKVVSGVYMIFISAPDGGDTIVKKVMIAR